MSESTFHLVSREPSSDDSPALRLARLCSQPVPSDLRDLKQQASKYLLSRDLEVAINMAITVMAPLLLTGEPGTGKTQVGYFLGDYFGVPVFPFHVKSTSTAADLKYEFDAVAYLRFAQRRQEVERSRREFLHKRALWRAYDCEQPAVVLIDEIDKAPRDFPNDLLHELDQHGFLDPFDESEVKPKNQRPPIVVVTSNAERRLPDAFLRRCIHHRIELDEALMREIVESRKDLFRTLDDTARNKAIDRFFELRRLEGLSKRPSTAELLTWLAILGAMQKSSVDLDGDLSSLPALAALIKDSNDFPKLG